MTRTVKACPKCERVIEVPRPTFKRPIGTYYPTVWKLCGICKPQRWDARYVPMRVS